MILFVVENPREALKAQLKFSTKKPSLLSFSVVQPTRIMNKYQIGTQECKFQAAFTISKVHAEQK